MLEGKTRLVATTTRVSGRTYERFLIHIPSKIAKDSQFPFKSGQELVIKVDPKGKILLSG